MATSVNNDDDVASGSLTDFTYTFVTGAVAPTGTVLAVFRGVDDGMGGGDSSRGDVDNYRVDASPIPEPASAALALLGSFGLLARRKRRA